jgi:hypothetical protein
MVSPFVSPRETLFVHLVTAAPTPSSRRRLAVCFGAMCEPGISPDAPPIHEDSGLPLASGTKDVTDVTCAACLRVAREAPLYRVHVERDGAWETVAAFIDFEPASFRAKAERADGYKSRVKQPAVFPW